MNTRHVSAEAVAYPDEHATATTVHLAASKTSTSSSVAANVRSDERRFDIDRYALLGMVLLVGAVLLFRPDDYFIHVASVMLVNIMLAMSLQTLISLSGQLSLGQAAFFGIGAYAGAIFAKSVTDSLPIALVAAGSASAALSLVLAPVTRLRGAYLAVATLGFTIIIHQVIKNEEWLTGGSYGLMNIPHPQVLGISLANPTATLLAYAAIVALTAVALFRLKTSRFARASIAVCEEETAAASLGINLTYYKSMCFILSAFISGAAGCMYMFHIRYLSPGDFGFAKSIEILTMVIIGGAGKLVGAILGGAIVTLVPEFLRVIDDYRLLIYGAVIVVVVSTSTGGLVSSFHQIGKGLQRTLASVAGKARYVHLASSRKADPK
jgi:branched-chain amino acid transport system permease protein